MARPEWSWPSEVGGEGGFPPPAPSAATAAGGARSSPKLPIFLLLITRTKPVSRAFAQLWFHAVGQRGSRQLGRACLSAALGAQGRACGCPHLELTAQHVLGAWMDPTIIPSAQSRDSTCACLWVQRPEGLGRGCGMGRRQTGKQGPLGRRGCPWGVDKLEASWTWKVLQIPCPALPFSPQVLDTCGRGLRGGHPVTLRNLGQASWQDELIKDGGRSRHPIPIVDPQTPSRVVSLFLGIQSMLGLLHLGPDPAQWPLSYSWTHRA